MTPSDDDTSTALPLNIAHSPRKSSVSSRSGRSRVNRGGVGTLAAAKIKAICANRKMHGRDSGYGGGRESGGRESTPGVVAPGNPSNEAGGLGDASAVSHSVLVPPDVLDLLSSLSLNCDKPIASPFRNGTGSERNRSAKPALASDTFSLRTKRLAEGREAGQARQKLLKSLGVGSKRTLKTAKGKDGRRAQAAAFAPGRPSPSSSIALSIAGGSDG